MYNVMRNWAHGRRRVRGNSPEAMIEVQKLIQWLPSLDPPLGLQDELAELKECLANFLMITTLRKYGETHIDVNGTLMTMDGAQQHYWSEIKRIQNLLNDFPVIPQSETRLGRMPNDQAMQHICDIWIKMSTGVPEGDDQLNTEMYSRVLTLWDHAFPGDDTLSDWSFLPVDFHLWMRRSLKTPDWNDHWIALIEYTIDLIFDPIRNNDIFWTLVITELFDKESILWHPTKRLQRETKEVKEVKETKSDASDVVITGSSAETKAAVAMLQEAEYRAAETQRGRERWYRTYHAYPRPRPRDPADDLSDLPPLIAPVPAPAPAPEPPAAVEDKETKEIKEHAGDDIPPEAMLDDTQDPVDNQPDSTMGDPPPSQRMYYLGAAQDPALGWGVDAPATPPSTSPVIHADIPTFPETHIHPAFRSSSPPLSPPVSPADNGGDVTDNDPGDDDRDESPDESPPEVILQPLVPPPAIAMSLPVSLSDVQSQGVPQAEPIVERSLHVLSDFSTAASGNAINQMSSILNLLAGGAVSTSLVPPNTIPEQNQDPFDPTLRARDQRAGEAGVAEAIHQAQQGKPPRLDDFVHESQAPPSRPPSLPASFSKTIPTFSESHMRPAFGATTPPLAPQRRAIPLLSHRRPVVTERKKPTAADRARRGLPYARKPTAADRARRGIPPGPVKRPLSPQLPDDVPLLPQQSLAPERKKPTAADRDLRGLFEKAAELVAWAGDNSPDDVLGRIDEIRETYSRMSGLDIMIYNDLDQDQLNIYNDLERLVLNLDKAPTERPDEDSKDVDEPVQDSKAAVDPAARKELFENAEKNILLLWENVVPDEESETAAAELENFMKTVDPAMRPFVIVENAVFDDADNILHKYKRKVELRSRKATAKKRKEKQDNISIFAQQLSNTVSNFNQIARSSKKPKLS
jgi:hypothetical protein